MTTSSTPSPGRPAPEPAARSLFSRIGGPDAVGAAVSVFYGRVLADPCLAGYFGGVDMTRLRSHQRWFLAAALGGPDMFTGRDLVGAHAGLGVTDEAFDRVVEHLTTTLVDLGVARAELAEVAAALAGLRSDIVTAAAPTGDPPA